MEKEARRLATIYRYEGLGVWLTGLRYQAGFRDEDHAAIRPDPSVYSRTYRGVMKKLARRMAENEPLGRFTGQRLGMAGAGRQIIVGSVEFVVTDAS